SRAREICRKTNYRQNAAYFPASPFGKTRQYWPSAWLTPPETRHKNGAPPRRVRRGVARNEQKPFANGCGPRRTNRLRKAPPGGISARPSLRGQLIAHNRGARSGN